MRHFRCRFSGFSIRGLFIHYVSEYLANLTRAGTNDSPVLILERENSFVSIERENYWFGVHDDSVRYYPSLKNDGRGKPEPLDDDRQMA